MGSVHKEHTACASSRSVQRGLQLGFQEFRLRGDMLFDALFRRQRNGSHAAPVQAQNFFIKARACVGLHSMPVRSLIRWQASAMAGA
jgi:hypothetical protein